MTEKGRKWPNRGPELVETAPENRRNEGRPDEQISEIHEFQKIKNEKFSHFFTRRKNAGEILRQKMSPKWPNLKIPKIDHKKPRYFDENHENHVFSRFSHCLSTGTNLMKPKIMVNYFCKKFIILVKCAGTDFFIFQKV